MRYLHIVGARPQYMKLAPLVREFNNQGLDFDILHTGQHYDDSMSSNFFTELNIEPPKFQFDNNNKPYPSMISDMINDISSVINDYTDVIVYGDTITTLAGALSSVFSGKKLHHVEAGVRCKNLEMPEEKIRRLVDEASNYLYCLTDSDMDNLSHVGGKVYSVGDLMYENFLSQKIKKIDKSGYIFVTIHREENTREKELTKIVEQLNELSRYRAIVFPIHPRTRSCMEKYGLKLEFDTLDAISYGEVLSYIQCSDCVISDSGGVPKEAYWLGKKSVVVLDGLVYPILEHEKYSVRSDYDNILESLETLEQLPEIENFNLFGDGKTSKKIVEILNG
jgi:UDP-N-acetylglucosamine 2-epimerase